MNKLFKLSLAALIVFAVLLLAFGAGSGVAQDKSAKALKPAIELDATTSATVVKSRLEAALAQSQADNLELQIRLANEELARQKTQAQKLRADWQASLAKAAGIDNTDLQRYETLEDGGKIVLKLRKE